jgi:hypothetical protein
VGAEDYTMKKTTKPKLNSRPSAKPGPKPEVLKLKGNWKSLMKKSLDKKKPPDGWPK